MFLGGGNYPLNRLSVHDKQGQKKKGARLQRSTAFVRDIKECKMLLWFTLTLTTTLSSEDLWAEQLLGGTTVFCLSVCLSVFTFLGCDAI